MDNQQLLMLREAIGKLDKSLLDLFAQRRALSLQVAEEKYSKKMSIRDQAQEQKLLKRLLGDAKLLGLDTSTTLSLFHKILDDSVRTQYDYFLAQETDFKVDGKLAVLGSKTSYSAIAARNHFSTKPYSYELHYFDNFQTIFSAIKNGDCDYGIIPIENTFSGNIPEIHDLIREFEVKVIGEEKLRVKHCLIGLAGAQLKDITDVYSHPQAIIQSKDFLTEYSHLNAHMRNSTSSALKFIEGQKQKSLAAIASEEAALDSDLQIIANGINNYQDNFTRFILIAKAAIRIPEAVPAKTSILITTQQQAGSLADCLNILKQYQINITKIESRPIIGKPWQERFYIDFEGNSESMKVKKAIHELELMTHDLLILGCYPLHDISATNLEQLP
ncbi:bifunctional chorismate mutase/prephenate dehydratase [Kangiella sp. HZ709]|uniref:bifunctional chorismate mutase/prephenate dehydratase n=1 Tax=Kangiella sp. HZ709 TaxID=2666328 RepID=UPI0012B0EF40|nr:prephenate dehydratase domain-containing protein [Kangiella sp. HZ709]MRX27122.1 prephenate dehydratase [Kangiella sp. HZ709]